MQSIKNGKTAEIVGLSFGDGSLTRRHTGKDKGKLRFQLRGSITEDKEHYDNYIRPLFNDALGIKVNSVICNGIDKSYGIATENQKVCELLKELGIPVGIKDELNIPAWIRSNKKLSKSFLRGLIDTDGSVYCSKDYNYPAKGNIKIRIDLSSISKNLIKQTSDILNELGVHNLTIKEYKPKNQNCKKFSKIKIEGPNVVKYFEFIGSKNLKHITKFQVWRKFGLCPPRTTLKQRQSLLAGLIEGAGVAEHGQMRKVEDFNQKPCPLVGARVQITSPAFQIN